MRKRSKKTFFNFHTDSAKAETQHPNNIKFVILNHLLCTMENYADIYPNRIFTCGLSVSHLNFFVKPKPKQKYFSTLVPRVLMFSNR